MNSCTFGNLRGRRLYRGKNSDEKNLQNRCDYVGSPEKMTGWIFALGDIFFCMQKSRRRFWRDFGRSIFFVFFGLVSFFMTLVNGCDGSYCLSWKLPIFSRNMSILDRLTGFSNVRKKKPTNMDPPNSPRRDLRGLELYPPETNISPEK